MICLVLRTWLPVSAIFSFQLNHLFWIITLFKVFGCRQVLDTPEPQIITCTILFPLSSTTSDVTDAVIFTTQKRAALLNMFDCTWLPRVKTT